MAIIDPQFVILSPSMKDEENMTVLTLVRSLIEIEIEIFILIKRTNLNNEEAFSSGNTQKKNFLSPQRESNP